MWLTEDTKTAQKVWYLQISPDISRYLQMISPSDLRTSKSWLPLESPSLRLGNPEIPSCDWPPPHRRPLFLCTNLAPTLGSCPSQPPSPPFLWSHRSLPTILGSESQLVSPCHPRCIQECHFQTSLVASRRIYASVQNGTEADVEADVGPRMRRIPQFPPWSRPVTGYKSEAKISGWNHQVLACFLRCSWDDEKKMGVTMVITW